MNLKCPTNTKIIFESDGTTAWDFGDYNPVKYISSQVFTDFLRTTLGICSNNLADMIVDVIYHDPATIVKWKDGTKTVVKCQKDKGDVYNPEQGLAMCIVKKICGNKGNYNDIFTKWLPKENNNEETV